MFSCKDSCKLLSLCENYLIACVQRLYVLGGQQQHRGLKVMSAKWPETFSKEKETEKITWCIFSIWKFSLSAIELISSVVTSIIQTQK